MDQTMVTISMGSFFAATTGLINGKCTHSRATSLRALRSPAGPLSLPATRLRCPVCPHSLTNLRQLLSAWPSKLSLLIPSLLGKKLRRSGTTETDACHPKISLTLTSQFAISKPPYERPSRPKPVANCDHFT